MIKTLKPGDTKNDIKNLLTDLVRDQKSKGTNVFKYVGKANLKKDALTIQKELRNEWR